MSMIQLTSSLSSRRTITTNKHYMTIVFGAWLIVGVFIDGFAHNHGAVETFFTPWHAILYSGFLASAAWMTWLLYQSKQATGGTWLQSAPTGYGLGLIGVAGISIRRARRYGLAYYLRDRTERGCAAESDTSCPSHWRAAYSVESVSGGME